RIRLIPGLLQQTRQIFLLVVAQRFLIVFIDFLIVTTIGHRAKTDFRGALFPAISHVSVNPLQTPPTEWQTQTERRST
ncbi:MAG: hypothetical protein AAF417_23655, partial [Pseudomonadota bacterium]